MGLKSTFLFLVLGAFIAVIYNACSPMESAQDSVSSSLSQVGEVDPDLSKATFASTLYPVLRNNCAQCHGVNQNPRFAVEDVNSAFSTVESRSLVNLSQPNQSQIYLKVSGGHQNFPVPVIDEILLQIQTWSRTVITSIPETPAEPITFDAAEPSSVLSKIKNLTQGGSLTPTEWSVLQKPNLDSRDLEQLARTWIDSAEGQAKLGAYLRVLLHQSVSLDQDSDELFNSVRDKTFEATLQESFVRTALDLIKRNRPFHEIATTRRFAVNSVILSAHAWMETDYPRTMRTAFRDHLRSSLVTPADYNDWRFVTFDDQVATPVAQAFSDMNHWRSINDGAVLKFAIPRVGYFSTIAFQAEYPTNADNQFRVTINQAMIAGLGRSYNPSDNTPQPLEVGIPLSHSEKGTQCYACHRLMDPMRMPFGFKMTYDYKLGRSFQENMGSFAFNNFNAPLSSVGDIGSSIANHPDFAQAWVQKMCEILNTKKCQINDPIFMSIVNDFKTSGFNFKEMYTKLVTSPLITGAEETMTSLQQGFDVARQRREHFCHNLQVRINQVREARGFPALPFDGGLTLCAIRNVSIPADALGDDLNVRGGESVVNSFPSDAFSSQAIERVCTSLAAQWVERDREFDPFNLSIDENLKIMTELLVGLPSGHPRHAPMLAALKETYNYGMQSKALGARNALRHSAILACQSPEIQGVGL